MGQVNCRFLISLNVEQCIPRGADNTCMLYYTEIFFSVVDYDGDMLFRRCKSKCRFIQH